MVLPFLALLLVGAGPDCALTAADKQTNASLSYQQFDQSRDVPSSWQALASRGCWAQAAEAMEDYLMRGPTPPTERAKTGMTFHYGQTLAHMGDHRSAARIIATAKRIEPTPLDWNTYVAGTYAFLVADRPALVQAHTRLKARPVESDQGNASVLAGLLHCFGKPYAEAHGTACRTAAAAQVPMPH
jgi:hypothetical protein